jgi:hypothetical protein
MMRYLFWIEKSMGIVCAMCFPFISVNKICARTLLRCRVMKVFPPSRRESV